MSTELFRLEAAKILEIGGGEDVDELMRLYFSRDRHYHDGNHILYCMKTLEAIHFPDFNAPAMKMALLYHDAIYTIGKKDNEMRSANLAAQMFGRTKKYQDEFRTSVRRLILATRHLGGLIAHDEQIIADVDLAGLGADWNTFEGNTMQIRCEWRRVSDSDFRSGRISFFEGMLAREWIYYTQSCRFLFEKRARENMLREIEEMKC